MGWFTSSSAANKELPADIWQICPSCQAHVFKDEWAANMKVCPKCNFHDRLGCRERIDLLVDSGSFREFNQHIVPSDPLNFSDAKEPYKAKAEATVKKLGISESVITGSGDVAGTRVVLAVMDFRFLGGSLASGTGEKIVLAIEHALRFKRAFIMVSASGGARMHEGIISLMQMAKTCAAVAKLEKARLPFISILSDPTTGGVSASYALIGSTSRSWSRTMTSPAPAPSSAPSKIRGAMRRPRRRSSARPGSTTCSNGNASSGGAARAFRRSTRLF